MPLDILIIGPGFANLSAGLSLRLRTLHRVSALAPKSSLCSAGDIIALQHTAVSILRMDTAQHSTFERNLRQSGPEGMWFWRTYASGAVLGDREGASNCPAVAAEGVTRGGREVGADGGFGGGSDAVVLYAVLSSYFASSTD
ncbi:hypothetical protein B0J12DRAFT_699937 [Macrophomina phaseolina]|uniref:Uncharacterized protein n=1 Tax=Macrophomina phaseolina TaxID=35725 RepID=A0ABQ8G9R1_9PEZI|nr:hypothetical protein B0J12DRAFT_699937 [Macrophomina phaseolina]